MSEIIPLGELRAGKMNFDGKKVAPDNRQGLLSLRLRVAEDEENLEICWREITDGVGGEGREEVLVVASEDGKFERVQAAKSGRVYVLKIQGERQFYWSQETDEVKEVELIGKFNAILSGDLDEIFSRELEFMVQDEEGDHPRGGYQPLGDWPENLSEELQQLPEDHNELLQWMMQQISDQPEEEPLDNIVTRDVLEDLINSDEQEISDQLKDLIPADQSVRECLLSPQFRQAIGNFGNAINCEEGAELLYATLGLEIADGDELRSPAVAFLHALNRKFA